VSPKVALVVVPAQVQTTPEAPVTVTTYWTGDPLVVFTACQENVGTVPADALPLMVVIPEVSTCSRVFGVAAAVGAGRAVGFGLGVGLAVGFGLGLRFFFLPDELFACAERACGAAAIRS
jgi:hypothetical protein